MSLVRLGDTIVNIDNILRVSKEKQENGRHKVTAKFTDSTSWCWNNRTEEEAERFMQLLIASEKKTLMDVLE